MGGTRCLAGGDTKGYSNLQVGFCVESNWCEGCFNGFLVPRMMVAFGFALDRCLWFGGLVGRWWGWRACFTHSWQLKTSVPHCSLIDC